MNLSWLIDPIPTDEFMNKRWCMDPIMVAREDPTYYANLLSESELEYIIQSALRLPGAVKVLEDEARAQPRSVNRAIEAVKMGKSLHIDSIQRFSFPIMKLCRTLQRVLGAHVSANLYLSPGCGPKAFRRRCATDNLFVIQLCGEKSWKLFGPAQVDPLEHLPLLHRETVREMRTYRLQTDHNKEMAVSLRDKFTLSPGDMLYLPRGVWYQATSVLRWVSCHLTIGVQSLTYLDLLTVGVAQAAERIPELRSSLPFGFTYDEGAVRRIVDPLQRILQELPSKISVPNAVGQLAATFLHSQRTSFESNLVGQQEVGCIDADTQLRVCAGAVFGLDFSTNPTRLICGEKAFSITANYIEACGYVARSESFTPKELPGNLTLEHRIALSRQLLSEGIVIRDSNSVSQRVVVPHRENWVPAEVNIAKRSVQWVDIGHYVLSEPFVAQTFERIRKQCPSTCSRHSSLEDLLGVKKEMAPAAFILHISRCGSTLLANELKHCQGAVVISEPQAIGEVLRMEQSSENTRDELLRGVINAYGKRRTGIERWLVFKLSSWNILYLDDIRRIWPGVPLLALVRNPLEVAVSCLEGGPGWMRWKRKPSRDIEVRMGATLSEIARMSREEFCARMLGVFLRQVNDLAITKECKVLDYQNLNASSVCSVSRYFGFDSDESTYPEMTTVYSKDPERARHFDPDGQAKRNRASAMLCGQIERWAMPNYRSILDSIATDRRMSPAARSELL